MDDANLSMGSMYMALYRTGLRMKPAGPNKIHCFGILLEAPRTHTDADLDTVQQEKIL
jgi:hypothetical protein